MGTRTSQNPKQRSRVKRKIIKKEKSKNKKSRGGQVISGSDFQPIRDRYHVSCLEGTT